MHAPNPSPVQDERIAAVTLASIALPLARPVSDAKVATGRQKPLAEVAVLAATVETATGMSGFGYSYCLRAGAPAQYAHALELSPLLLGETADDIGRLWQKLSWAGASIGRGGLAAQAIAAFDVALWDLKAKRAGLSLSRLLGRHRDSVRCYNTSGGYLQASLSELRDGVARARERGIGGIKAKIGQPDAAADLRRLAAVREAVGDGFPLMADVNQQWDRPTALRLGRALEPFGLVFLEEPLAGDDVEGHALLASRLSTPIATGEMLSSVAEHFALLRAGAAHYLQPDAPRVGGITPFLRVMALADQFGVEIAPHFVMEMHLPLLAACPREPWIEHFEWFEPLFEERFPIRDGRIGVPDLPGLGLTLSERAAGWTKRRDVVGRRP